VVPFYISAPCVTIQEIQTEPMRSVAASVVETLAPEAAGRKTRIVWTGSTAELQGLEPFDSFTLVGDDLCLPKQTERHEAQEKNADSESEVGVSFTRREAKGANQPRHL